MSTVPLQSHKRRHSPKKRDLPNKSTNENYSRKIPEKPLSTCSQDISDIDEEDDSATTIRELYEKIDHKCTTTNVSTQVTSGDLTVPFISLINSSKSLNTMTGIPSLDLLNKIEELYRLQFPDKRSHNLSYRERTVMIFMKFKQDLSFVVLSILFKNVSPESCRLIYTTIIPSLAMILNSVIYWPSKQEISSNIPYCFEKFKNTRVVIDCTEIAIQKPQCLTCRIKTYSNYKSTFTLKFLIGISPGGLITYVSKPYGGRASDKIIFEQSGLIKMMERFDGIMVDKGFLIDDLCLEKQIELIRPPFLKNKTMFSKTEALLNKE